MSFERDPFKCFVSIEKTIDESAINQMMTRHIGYPIDNVIQIKLSKDSFTKLFKSSAMNSSSVDVEERYYSPELLTKLENFFSSQYHNYNSIASDITILINNTYSEKIDINPSNLENACKTNGQIFDYFFLSECNYLYSSSAENYDGTSNSGKMKVYEAIARELDNMITRDISSDETTSLEELYSIQNDNFWNNLVEGDSIFIDGSFNIPGDYNVPIIIQFLNMNKDIGYSFTSEINGSALDGYIANGNVKVFNLKNKLIYQTTTNETGDFSVVNIDPPFKVEISGGTDIATNEPNDLILTSLKMNNKDNLTVTPITSMLVDTFEEQRLELTEENLNSVKTTVASKMGIYEQNIYEDFIETNNSDLASKALQFAHLYRVTKSLGIENEKQIKKKLVSKILENDLETVATDSTTINSLITDIYDTFDSQNTNRTEITTNAVQIIKTVNENYKNSQNNLADLYKISKGYQKNNDVIKNGVIDHMQSTENISNSIQNSINEIPVESIYKLNKNDSSKSKPVILNSVKIPFNQNLIVYLDASNYNTENPLVWEDMSGYQNHATFKEEPIYNNSSFSIMGDPAVQYTNYINELNPLLFHKEYTLIYVVNLKELYENTTNSYWAWNTFSGGHSSGSLIIERLTSPTRIRFLFGQGTYDWDAQTYFDADAQRKEKYFMMCFRKYRTNYNNVYQNNLQLYDSEGSLLINETSNIYNYTHIYTIGSSPIYFFRSQKLRSIIMYNSILSDTDLQNIRDYYLLSSSTVSYPMSSLKRFSNINSDNVSLELKSTDNALTVTKISDGTTQNAILKKVSDDGNIMFFQYGPNKTVYIKDRTSNTVQEISNQDKTNFGFYLEISGDGSTVAIGHNYSGQRHWYVYKKINATWILKKSFESDKTLQMKINYDGSVLIRRYYNSSYNYEICKYENDTYVRRGYNSPISSNICMNKSGNIVTWHYGNGAIQMLKETDGSWVRQSEWDLSNSTYTIEPQMPANSDDYIYFITQVDFITDDGNYILGRTSRSNEYKVLEYNPVEDKYFQKGNFITYGYNWQYSKQYISNDANIIIFNSYNSQNEQGVQKVGKISVFIYNVETNEYDLFKEFYGINANDEWFSDEMKIIDRDNKQKIKIVTSNKNNEILHFEISNLSEIYHISNYEF